MALLIIFIILLFFVPFKNENTEEKNAHEDILKVLSNLKLGEINNSYISSLITQGNITDLNKSILEQIAEFYALKKPEAQELVKEMLDQFNSTDNLGLWFNGKLVYTKNKTSYEDSRLIWNAKELVSGIKEGNSSTGFSARAYLSKSALTEYFYFGGYVGDGNITALLNISGSITGASIEMDINKNFSLYINGNFIGNYNATSGNITLINLAGSIGNFISGENKIELKGDFLYIAGGFVAVDYETTSVYQARKRYNFPGINGLINLYDSFYVPGTLNNMQVFLHFNVSNSTLFMTIGNVSIYNTSASGETSATITNSQLSSLLNYNDLSNKTIPFRLGLVNVSQATSGSGNADVVLITDLSNSMNWRIDSDIDGLNRTCNNPDLYNSSTNRISLAKCLDKQVVDTILSFPGNRISLVGFYGDVGSPNKGRIYEQAFTDNKTLLYEKIDAYSPQGGTCICCAINDGWALINEGSNITQKKFLIVMSDGIPTHTCQAANGCTGTRTGRPSDEGLWLGQSSGCYGGSDDCNVADCQCASKNANWSSCRVNRDFNATAYSVGFGPINTCSMANNTLRDVAACGKGKFFTSDNATELQSIYNNIANEIITLSYIEQTAIASGLKTVLYTNSYISFNFSNSAAPEGIALSKREQFYNDNYGNFSTPNGFKILEANVLSYSGAKWTNNVSILNVSSNVMSNIFNLNNFGNDYVKLGDPYAINIPNLKISQGNNQIFLSTGISPLVSFNGSQNDKIAITFVKPAASYSAISIIADGCNWTVTNGNNKNISFNVPSNYTGTDQCEYIPGKNPQYDNNDAYDLAIISLIKELDFDNDGDIDVSLSQQNIKIDAITVQGIPFTWSSEIEIRVWR